MKTVQRIIIGIWLATLYYLADAALDLLTYRNAKLGEIAFTDIPSGEPINRLLGILLVVTIYLLWLRLRIPGSQTPEAVPAAPTNPALDYLNSFKVVEMVAAQLKTTMNTVLGFLNLVKDKNVSQQARGVFTEYVYTSSSGLLQLFNNLVELYQILNGKTARTSGKVSINQVLGDLEKKYTSELKHHTKCNLQLQLHIPDEFQELVLDTDGNKLISILEALLQNAIGFSHNGTINYGYTIVEDKEIQFFFHDNGAGISMEQLENAFRTYMDNPSGMDISYDLAALRMEVARRLTEVLGGKIWSNSKLGSGSSFYFSLPVESQLQNITKTTQTDELRPDWSQCRILIAEDIDSNYMLLKTLLSASNVEIVRAKTGSEAVHLYENNSGSFQAILMDIVMPEMDGFEAASRIKRINGSIPIIGQTAYCLDSEDDKGKLQHFDDFLTKPIWSHELLRTLGKYL